MDKIEKYLTERNPTQYSRMESSSMKSSIKNMDKNDYGKLRDYYFGISDNTYGMMEILDILSKKDKIFSKEIANVKKILSFVQKFGFGKFM